VRSIRSLFEISKGSLEDKSKSVISRVSDHERWVQIRDMIYVADGETDIPALSVVCYFGGLGVVIYSPQNPAAKQKLKNLCLDKQADFITEANFKTDVELFDFVSSR
jgi:hypothetical protein